MTFPQFRKHTPQGYYYKLLSKTVVYVVMNNPAIETLGISKNVNLRPTMLNMIIGFEKMAEKEFETKLREVVKKASLEIDLILKS